MKVSVILPVYNVAAYICGCIDSLCTQTLGEAVEFLFVDDHGTDDSITRAYIYIKEKTGAVEYVKEKTGAVTEPLTAQTAGGDPQADDVEKTADARPPLVAGNRTFRFLRTARNSGPGVAHNVGIAAARGEYIALVDSDDTIEPTMLAELTAAADRVGADIAYCRLRYRGGRSDGRENGNPAFADGELTDAVRRRFLVGMRTFCPTFLYRRSFLVAERLAFPANRSSEDSNFLIQVLLCARRMACVERALYVYNVRPSSLTTTRNAQRVWDKLAAFDALMHEAAGRGWLAAYGDELGFVYAKKAFAVGMLNYLVNTERVEADALARIRRALDAAVPAWRTNACLRHRTALRLLVRFLYAAPLWTMRLARRFLPASLAL